MKTTTWKESDLSAVSPESTIFWFRRDLRLADNSGLYHALKDSQSVLPIFIYDAVILEELDDKKDRRIEFIRDSLEVLKKDLEDHGTSLLVLYGDPVALFKKMKVRAIYTNHDYEPYARKRDDLVKKNLEKNGGEFHSFKDQVIFEKDEVTKDDGKPYTVFTPYSKKWKAKLTSFYYKSYPTEKYVSRFQKTSPFSFPDLSDIGFEKTGAAFPPRIVKRTLIEKYDETRNFPAIPGTTRLSVHLRFGTVSIRKLVDIARQKNQVWLNELIWRDFYQMILWHFPQIQTESFKPAYDQIDWRNDPNEFDAWCKGITGYPIVDAGMRELNETGFMHNRVRMIVASFLTKHLLIDWRWGEAYFGKKLLDYDLAANNGGWQWAAGTGCDAAPYFRVFNPALQTDKFDHELKYVRKWVPEFETDSYIEPIVKHEVGRDRALTAYKKALNRGK